jgi:glycosyltransferase involved in cell wall biosynthesis
VAPVRARKMRWWPEMLNKVALLITQLAADGGAEAQVSSLAREFARLGWGVHIISMRPPQMREDIPGIPVHSLELVSVLDVPAAILRLRAILNEVRPTVLHSHMTHANLLARMTRPLLQVPVVINTLHGLRMYNTRGEGYRIREAAHRLTDSMADLTTAVCTEAGRYYVETKAVSASRMRTIPNGVDTELFRPDASLRSVTRRSLGLLDDEFAWICAARFQPVKNHEALLLAFREVIALRPDSVLLLAGDGPGHDGLKRLSRELAIDDKVRFLGRRLDLPALLNAADSFAMASRFEALSIALLEAAACGLPIACTDVGGNRDIVRNGWNGFLAQPDASDLGAAMMQIAVLDDDARRRMSAQAREHIVRRFEIQSVAQSWCDLYLQLSGAVQNA